MGAQDGRQCYAHTHLHGVRGVAREVVRQGQCGDGALQGEGSNSVVLLVRREGRPDHIWQ